MDMSDYRKTIDSIDTQIVELFKQRMDTAKSIAQYKKENSLPIYDGARERDLLAKVGEMYNHARLFNHVTLQPGCSIGYHTHEHETEFYYIIKGEGLFSDNGKEVMVHTGDVCVTGFGEGHSLENCTEEPLEMIALVVME